MLLIYNYGVQYKMKDYKQWIKKWWVNEHDWHVRQGDHLSGKPGNVNNLTSVIEMEGNGTKWENASKVLEKESATENCLLLISN